MKGPFPTNTRDNPAVTTPRAEVEPPLDVSVLSPAERRVLEQALQGRTARDIAGRLVLTEATVRSHLSHIYAKLGVAGQVELMGRAPSGIEAENAVPTSAPSAPTGVAEIIPVFAVCVLLAILSVVGPYMAFVIGPGLLLGARTAGRSHRFRAWQPTLLLFGAVISLWAVFVAVIFLFFGAGTIVQTVESTPILERERTLNVDQHRLAT